MKKIIQLILFATIIVGCGGYNTGIIQKAEKGFIKFSGNTLDATVSIDNGKEIKILQTIDQYEIKPGKHTIQVFKNNKQVVNRIIIVDNQTIFEVDVP